MYVQLISRSLALLTPCSTDRCEIREINAAVPTCEFLKAMPYVNDFREHSVSRKLMGAVRTLPAQDFSSLHGARKLGQLG